MKAATSACIGRSRALISEDGACQNDLRQRKDEVDTENIMGADLHRLSIYSISAIGIGLLLGFASILLSPLWILAGIIAVAFFVVLIKRPEIGLLGYLVITSTVVNGDSLPRLSIGVGKILITDIILLALLGTILIRALAEHDFKLVRTPLDLPLLVFLGIAFLSTFIAINQSRLTFNASLGEIRMLMSYLTFFVVTNLLRGERQLLVLLRGLFGLASLVALAMIVQFILGSRIPILFGRVETLGTEGETILGVTRIIPPGESLIFPTFIALTVSLMLNRHAPIQGSTLATWGLTGVGVLLTFKRNLWIAIFCILLVLAIFGWNKVWTRMIGGGFAIVLMGVALVSLIFSFPESKPAQLASGAFERLASLANPGTFEDPNSSLRWRDFEYQFAMPQIAAHPLLGLGQGAMYRPFVIGKDSAEFDGRRYIHNGHLHLIVKAGLLGYLSFVAFTGVALVRGFRFWKQIPNTHLQAILLGFTLAYLGILIGSLVSPMIVTAWWTPVIGTLLGVNEVALRSRA